jgi:hypothetical protein
VQGEGLGGESTQCFRVCGVAFGVNDVQCGGGRVDVVVLVFF